MPATPLLYRALAAAGSALAPLAGLADPKIREGHRGRRGAAGRLRAWSEQRREAERPLIWFHASSVGEGLQAESVLRELRALLPQAQYAYTHFSPSARGLAGRVPVDVAEYLPYDQPHAVRDILAALTPDLLVFAKLDLWPELATRAATRGVVVAMVAATVSPGSGRLRWPARPLLRAGYQALTAAAAISHEDAERLARLGVPPDRVRVLGDPRFDSVAARVRSVAPDDPLLSYGRGAPTLVAGSTWPGDEAVLLSAFTRLLGKRPDARLIVVPHEPSADHLAAVERAARRLALPQPVRLSQTKAPVPLLLVDRAGLLAALYGAGTMAYVGGGFGRAGLHSVLEPAAWGIPVAFGPRWGESRDARLLLEAGAAEALAGGRDEAVEGLRRRWSAWMNDEAGRAAQGAAARAVVTAGLGAARRSAEWLAKLISPRPLRTSPSGARPGPG
ncbi:MAG TPA: glycosyltransferase N-terminal domain-containing protein [Gemmatimonadales bacterium]